MFSHKEVFVKVSMTRSFLIAILILASYGCSGGGETAAPITYSALISQPTVTTLHNGPIDTSIVQNFPSISTILAEGNNAFTPAGLYSWYYNYYTAYNSNPPLQSITSIGLKNIRVGFGYNETMTDAEFLNLMNFTAASGSRILFALMGYQRQYFADGVYSPTISSDLNFLSPTDDTAFINNYLTYLDTVLGNFGPNGSFFTRNPSAPYHPIIYVEIWNEPNGYYLFGAENWNGGGTGTTDIMDRQANLYSKLLMASYAHIRANTDWNTVKVVAISGSDGGEAQSYMPASWIRLVHQYIVINGGNFSTNDYYDIVSDHPYTHDAPPDTQLVVSSEGLSFSLVNMFAEIQSCMADYGQSAKPVWFTEVGWAAIGGAFPDAADAITRNLQAAYTARLYAMVLRLGVQAVHIMFIQDGDNFNGGFFNNSNNAWYPQATAAQVFCNLLPNPRMKSVISETNGLYIYKIDPDSKGTSEVIMAWNVTAPLRYTFTLLNASYTVMDMLGDKDSKAITNGSLTQQIGPYPIYIYQD